MSAQPRRPFRVTRTYDGTDYWVASYANVEAALTEAAWWRVNSPSTVRVVDTRTGEVVDHATPEAAQVAAALKVLEQARTDLAYHEEQESAQPDYSTPHGWRDLGALLDDFAAALGVQP